MQPDLAVRMPHGALRRTCPSVLGVMRVEPDRVGLIMESGHAFTVCNRRAPQAVGRMP